MKRVFWVYAEDWVGIKHREFSWREESKPSVFHRENTIYDLAKTLKNVFIKDEDDVYIDFRPPHDFGYPVEIDKYKKPHRLVARRMLLLTEKEIQEFLAVFK